jgi:hypothetical protein
MAVKVAFALIEGPNNSQAWIKATGSYPRRAAFDAASREAAASERAAPASQAQQR